MMFVLFYTALRNYGKLVTTSLCPEGLRCVERFG